MKITQKGAMLGKLSQLNHINLTSLRAKRGNLLSKTGAMFGLDARIALAIFGALSVISGAALYSAIQNARLESFRQNTVEIAKAVEQYYLDTGTMLTAFNAVALNLKDLVVNPGVTGWNGPYLDYTANSITITKESNPYLTVHLYKQENSTLGSTTSGAHSNSPACTDILDCGYWLKYHLQLDSSTKYPNAENFALELDRIIDNADGETKGNLRINWFGSDKTDPIIFYYVMSANNI